MNAAENAATNVWWGPAPSLAGVRLVSLWPYLASAGPQPGYSGGLRADMHNPVLVVDDDRAIRDSLRLVLEDEGYAVVEARDGAEAMSVLRGAAQPMVVLLDIMMPRMTGEDVLREVSHDARLQTNNAFVVITANRHALSAAFRQQLLGMSIPILDKPPDIEDVIAHVMRAEQRLPPTRN
jgi:CheY-like chemotaxis protein